MPAIRLITLDLDDTLWPCLPVIQAAEEALHDWLKEQAPRLAQRQDLASMRAHRLALMEREPDIAHDLGLVRHRSLVGLLDDHGYDRTLADAGMTLFMDHRCRVEPYADVLPALRVLSQRYLLVSLTNGNSNLEVTPLKGLFRHRINAAEAGAAKPHPAMFERALALTECRPEQCLHLGDDPRRDVEAARNAGLTAVWINRAGAIWPDALPAPALTITTLDELARWLDGNDDAI